MSPGGSSGRLHSKQPVVNHVQDSVRDTYFVTVDSVEVTCPKTKLGRRSVSTLLGVALARPPSIGDRLSATMKMMMVG